MQKKQLMGEILQSLDEAKERTKGKKGKRPYDAIRCRNMIILDNDIILSCKKLLKPSKENSDGFIRLLEEGLLELSVENIILKPCYKDLPLEEERKEAKKRLGIK